MISHIDSDLGYVHGKLVAACRSFYEYFENKFEKDIYHDLSKDELWQLTVDVQYQFTKLVEDTRGLNSQEISHIRFVFSLLQYLMQQIHSVKNNIPFNDVPAILTKEFQDLAALLFHIHLGVKFPDPLLEENSTDLRSFCSSAWERFKKENSL